MPPKRKATDGEPSQPRRRTRATVTAGDHLEGVAVEEPPKRKRRRAKDEDMGDAEDEQSSALTKRSTVQKAASRSTRATARERGKSQEESAAPVPGPSAPSRRARSKKVR